MKQFLFYLDLSEMAGLDKKMKLFGASALKLYRFLEKDHSVLSPIREGRFGSRPQSIRLLTHVRLMGYVFNPVSFFFLDADSSSPALVAEVGNTFGEQKPYYLGADRVCDGLFKDRQVKNYYISPFSPLDAELDFAVGIPAESLSVRINEWREGKCFYTATMTGQRRSLSDAQLFWYAWRYPLMTVQVIAAIHWHAFKLWRMKVPHHAKEESPELQTGRTRARD